MGRIIGARLLSPFVGQRLKPFLSLGKKEDLESLVRLIEAGDVAPVVGRTLPFVEVPEALRYVGEGHARGKTVIVVSADDRGTIRDDDGGGGSPDGTQG